MSKTICHITTVHKAKDMRIFYKECVSLAKAGFEVKLIVINGESETVDGVEIIGVPCNINSKLQRFLKAGKAAYEKALQLNAAVCHFHDPEFLWYGYKLIKQGKKVIYDAHEDVPRQILGKAWIPSVFRKPFSFLFEKFENYFAARLTGIVTVTDFILERFLKVNPNTITVKNFPILAMLPQPGNWENKKNWLCYIGDITRVRGIIEMVKPLDGLPVKLALGGKFSQAGLRKETTQLAGWQNVIEYGFVNRVQAKEMLEQSKIGLVLLHPIINYQDALPVKLFEFMAAGIPVIASDLRLQKQIVTDNNCGIVVDTFDTKAVQEAIMFLINNPEQAKAMGMNGRKAVEEKYSWAYEEKKLIDFYKNLIK